MSTRDLVLIGPPGSGKGTQSQRLVSERGWAQLATGDLFRHHLKERTELGRTAQGYMDRGELVPDEVTVAMVRERLREIPTPTRIVFDGFPRTVPQADALTKLLAEFDRTLAAVLLLEVPRDEIVRRLVQRAREQGRTDDTPEVIARRFDVYEERTRPVVEHYDARALVRRVNGVGPIEEVARRLGDAAEGSAASAAETQR